MALVVACVHKAPAVYVAPIAAVTRAVAVGPIRAVAGDGAHVFVASGESLAWGERSVALPGTIGPIAATGHLVAATLSITGDAKLAAAPIAMRGEPGAVVAAFDVATGAAAWRVPLDASEYAIATSICIAPDDGFIVGGSFAGTLRAGEGAASAIVSSAGKSDGFVVRIAPSGAVTWLVRLGGMGADAVQGVAFAGDRVAITGTFATGAELAGVPLPPFDDRLPFADIFVAELDVATGARKWATTFGGRGDDSATGIAIDPATGNVAVAANLRGTMRVGTRELKANGASDGLVVWLSPAGELGATTILGGPDFDGTRAIVAVGDDAIVAGFFSGTIALGSAHFAAGGGDDAFLAEVTPAGAVVRAWQVGGAGREEIASLAALGGGFVAGVAHTAELVLSGIHLPAPQDPMLGAALVIRGVP
ncbi:MAG TPA: hypothetical protein VH143_02760 [Kofleriaceae bacterium]|nr:hypothetical protein [Kofleriaceae bacterium]